jgi:hypothetical protein
MHNFTSFKQISNNEKFSMYANKIHIFIDEIQHQPALMYSNFCFQFYVRTTLLYLFEYKYLYKKIFYYSE